MYPEVPVQGSVRGQHNSKKALLIVSQIHGFKVIYGVYIGIMETKMGTTGVQGSYRDLGGILVLVRWEV